MKALGRSPQLLWPMTSTNCFLRNRMFLVLWPILIDVWLLCHSIDGLGKNGMGPSSSKTKRPKASWCCRMCTSNVDFQWQGSNGLRIHSTDYVIIQDKSFKKYAKSYADSEEVFFKEYVPTSQIQMSWYSLLGLMPVSRRLYPNYSNLVCRLSNSRPPSLGSLSHSTSRNRCKCLLVYPQTC